MTFYSGYLCDVRGLQFTKTRLSFILIITSSNWSKVCQYGGLAR